MQTPSQVIEATVETVEVQQPAMNELSAVQLALVGGGTGGIALF